MAISRKEWSGLVAQVQRNDAQLAELDFRNRKIEDPAYLETLGTALKTNSVVVAIDWGNNPISLAGLRALEESLKTNKTLIKFDVKVPESDSEMSKVIEAVRKTLYQSALQSAGKGNAFAQYWVGYCNAQGTGTTPDSEAAFGWYTKSAKQKYTEAQYLLAVSMQEGFGTEKNVKQAVELFTELAKDGHLGAMCSLVQHYTTQAENLGQAAFWCKKAADKGDAPAQCYFGQMCLHGNGVAQDIPSGISYLRQAASQGEKGASDILNQLGVSLKPASQVPLLLEILQQNAAEYAQEPTAPAEVLGYLDEQQSNFVKQKADLEAKVNALEQKLKSSVASADMQRELLNLKAGQQELLAEHSVKVQRREAALAFQASPNLWSHYRAINIRLEQVFIGCMAVASEFIETDLTGNMSTAATAITVAGKLASLIPFIGNALDTVVSTASTALEAIDHQRQTNILTTMASLGTLSDIKKASELTARRLTERYREQLEKLPTEELDQTRSEALKQASRLGQAVQVTKGAANAVNSYVLKGSTSTAAEDLADFAMSQIVVALLDGAIDSTNPLEDQFLAAVTTPPSKLDQVKQAISAKLGIGTITTTDDLTWQIAHIYHKPGIKTAQGVCYISVDTLHDLYGYRLGTDDEALKLKMTKQKQVVVKPSAIPVATSTAVSAPALAPSAPSASLASLADLESLRRELAEQKEISRRQQEQLEKHAETNKKLHEKVEKLAKKNPDTDQTVDLGAQAQLQLAATGFASPQGARGATIIQGVYQELSGHDQRLATLEVILMTGGRVVPDQPKETDADKQLKKELFK